MAGHRNRHHNKPFGWRTTPLPIELYPLILKTNRWLIRRKPHATEAKEESNANQDYLVILEKDNQAPDCTDRPHAIAKRRLFLPSRDWG